MVSYGIIVKEHAWRSGWMMPLMFCETMPRANSFLVMVFLYHHLGTIHIPPMDSFSHPPTTMTLP